ncbi:hypothetical protein GA0070606_3379 [Micromonospora citrea]|uniref:DUF11 domain-containing protein n=1 Tax=Micromonospora citrea TaxID=47855 RepID=A0A1C6V402_9ACTN|nr:hypothetical protein [Micromonospora citrea]SCL61071.1 hypothetical protein GA0070606_3379 [Micromonospora citrea]
MSEHESTPELDGVFTAFRAGGPLVVPPGAGAARAVARRRRTNRVVATGLIAAALAATPVLANAWAAPDTPTQPAQTGAPAPTSPPTTTPSVPSPSATSASAAPPDGRIGAKELGNATLDLPAWPAYLADKCPSGRVRFRDGSARRSPDAELDVRILQVVHADLDRDGARETAALLNCSGQEMSESRVLAFDRDRSGTIETMGLVVAQTGEPWPPAPDTIAGIRRIRVAGSAIEAEVTDLGQEGLPASLAQHQWRAYSWSGRGFVQSGGPTVFPANPRITDLWVRGEDLLLTPADADRATFVLRLSAGNRGPQRAADPQLRVVLPAGSTVTSLPPGCTSSGTTHTCRLKALAVGEFVNIDLPVSVRRSEVGVGRVGEYSATVAWTDRDGAAYPEPPGGHKDNSITREVAVSE